MPRIPALCLLLTATAVSLPGQTNILSIKTAPRAVLERNAVNTATVTVQLRNGFHVNSNKPMDDYLIPLRLTWEPGGVEVLEIVYPEPRLEKYDFSAKPLSVFSGSFDLITKLKVPANAQTGPGMVAGKLRYQACTEKMCFPPKTLDVKMQIEIK
ncbi:MAG: protein-disulfide reductase DsbD N-terminal domain-containing protein [Bryobacterales bacterium]|nr:protein-disulfide reductase DsbD N-terminal domain-containing protein [Bryobacterales bacterium]MEB2359863.1 protein-disulfide reductase DsbD family protein [Bryobacterales bacterium]